MPARPPKKPSSGAGPYSTYLAPKTRAQLQAIALIQKRAAAKVIEEGITFCYQQLSAEDRKLVDQIVQRTEGEL